jgi:hypothetical protein
LLASRRFRYTRVAVCSPGYELGTNLEFWRDAEWLNVLASMPISMAHTSHPFKHSLRRSKAHPVFGQQWGLFTVEDIAPNTLIGEYACDVLAGQELVLCEKPDSIMQYSGEHSKRPILGISRFLRTYPLGELKLEGEMQLCSMESDSAELPESAVGDDEENKEEIGALL